MKNSKKIILIILFVVALFSMQSVEAATTLYQKEKFTKKKTDVITVSGLTVTGITNPYHTNYYDFYDPESEDFVGYCMDPHKDSGSDYYIDRILGDTTNSERIQSFDLGILEIMKNGYNQYNEGSSDLYAATSIAIRAFALGLYGYGGDISSSSKYYNYYAALASAHIAKGVEWAAQSQDATSLITTTKCTGDNSKDYATCYENTFIKSYLKNSWYNSKNVFKSSDTQSNSIIDQARNLFMIGLEKAYEVRSGNVTTATVKNGKVTKDSKESDGTNYTQTYYTNIEFENFDADSEKGKIYKIKFECPTCKEKGITVDKLQYQTESGVWRDVEYDKNVLEDFTAKENGKKSGTIKLKFKITRKDDEDNCKPADFTISYVYKDSSLEYIGGLLKASGQTNKQRFFILQKADEIAKTITGTIACDATCQTEITTPECLGDATGSVKVDTDTKKCVIDNTDDADNSYQFTSNNGGVENNYCKVYCKEDYAQIKLEPVIEGLTCGDYFKLTSYIEGTKSCYTGGDTEDGPDRNGEKSIDKDLYVDDITNDQIKMINGYDLWKKGKTAQENQGNISENTFQVCGVSITNYSLTGYYDGKNYKIVDKDEGIVEAIDANKGYSYASTTSYTRDTTTKWDEESQKMITVCTGVTITKYASKQEIYNAIKADIDAGIGAMRGGFNSYKNHNTQYNQCTTGWTNNFKFEQQIEYYYDEMHSDENIYTPYYDLIEGSDSIYLEKGNTSSEKGNIYVWTGKTSKEIDEKDGNAKNLPISVDNGGKGKYASNLSYGTDIFEERAYTICPDPETGCETDEGVYISQASFVKKAVEKSQDYITPTSFYQIEASGKITTVNYTGTEVKVQALENQLPTSPSVVGGGNFKLKLQDLGEFYNSDELGRIFDVDGENESKSVANALKESGAFDGNYACEYHSLCRSKDCPNCDFTCDGDNCHWIDCPTCNFTCVNCLFNFDELNFNVSTITTTKVQSVDRTYGYNWVTSSDLSELKLLTQKAEKTIDEIEDLNEMVYNDEKSADGESSLGFSIVLNSSIISDIKKYNKEQEENGGYINDSLTCYDATVNGSTYKNIYCYSNFIDELYAKYDEAITISDKRINDEGKRESGTQASGYWTLYDTSGTLGNWHETNVIGGPSWK